jgi:hypothetical protein
MEVTFRQVGDGALAFPESTDVPVNGYGGIPQPDRRPRQRSSPANWSMDGVWDLIGRLAEDVTA